MSWLLNSFSSFSCLALYCSILIRLGTALDPVYFCSRHIYDSPGLLDCSHALAALPRANPLWRYYIEPQVEAAPPVYDWLGWVDQRPPTLRQRVIQIPKF